MTKVSKKENRGQEIPKEYATKIIFKKLFLIFPFSESYQRICSAEMRESNQERLYGTQEMGDP